MGNPVSPYKPKQYVRDILKSQLVSIIGGLLAGSILAARIKHLHLLPGFFILFPGFLELQGNINATIAARIGSLLHTKGIKQADEIKDPQVKNNLLAAFTLSTISSIILGAVCFLLTFLILRELVLKLILISLLSGLIVSLILVPLTLVTSVWLYKRGLDPDNVMGPFLTSLTDIISVVVLILVIGILIP